MFRAEVPILSWATIQEAILNACTHRDYRNLGNIYIKHYEDGVSIGNPGGFIGGMIGKSLVYGFDFAHYKECCIPTLIDTIAS